MTVIGCPNNTGRSASASAWECHSALRAGWVFPGTGRTIGDDLPSKRAVHHPFDSSQSVTSIVGMSVADRQQQCCCVLRFSRLQTHVPDGLRWFGGVHRVALACDALRCCHQGCSLGLDVLGPPHDAQGDEDSNGESRFQVLQGCLLVRRNSGFPHGDGIHSRASRSVHATEQAFQGSEGTGTSEGFSGGLVGSRQPNPHGGVVAIDWREGAAPSVAIVRDSVLPATVDIDRGGPGDALPSFVSPKTLDGDGVQVHEHFFRIPSGMMIATGFGAGL